MAKVIPSPRTLNARIKTVLCEGLKTAGIKIKPSHIFIEPIARTKLRRVTIVSPEFSQMRPTERQDLIWRIMNQQFSPEEQLHISMILTLSPHELVGLSNRQAHAPRQGWNQSFSKARRRAG